MGYQSVNIEEIVDSYNDDANNLVVASRRKAEAGKKNLFDVPHLFDEMVNNKEILEVLTGLQPKENLKSFSAKMLQKC